MYSLILIVMGSFSVFQNAINTRLNDYSKSPFLSSAVSFIVGGIFLAILLLFQNVGFAISWSTVVNNPWWLWTVGLSGSFSLSVNILLFDRLGSVQTAVLPIVGQIIMGVIIDQFGLFYSPISKLDFWKTLGLLLVIVGMYLAVVLSNRQHTHVSKNVKGKFFWQMMGILAGLIVGLQKAINGRAGIVFHSTVKASLIAFIIGAVTLLIVSMIVHVPLIQRAKDIRTGVKQHWWIIIGGLLGGTYTFLSSWLVPKIGTGEVVVVSLFGQLLFSALIDQLGILEPHRIRVNWIRALGLIMMFIGVICIRMI